MTRAALPQIFHAPSNHCVRHNRLPILRLAAGICTGNNRCGRMRSSHAVCAPTCTCAAAWHPIRRQVFPRSLLGPRLPPNASPLWPVSTRKKASPRGTEIHLTAAAPPTARSTICTSSPPRTARFRLARCCEVTNLSNGMQTQVRINDRGPFVANRVIELSPSQRLKQLVWSVLEPLAFVSR